MAVQFSLCSCMCVQSTLELGPLCTNTALQRKGKEGNTEGRRLFFFFLNKALNLKRNQLWKSVEVNLKDGLTVGLIPCFQLRECEINTLLFNAKHLFL